LKIENVADLIKVRSIFNQEYTRKCQNAFPWHKWGYVIFFNYHIVHFSSETYL